MLTARRPVQDAADVVLELLNAGADYNAKNENDFLEIYIVK